MLETLPWIDHDDLWFTACSLQTKTLNPSLGLRQGVVQSWFENASLLTLLETNVAPENRWLENHFPLGKGAWPYPLFSHDVFHAEFIESSKIFIIFKSITWSSQVSSKSITHQIQIHINFTVSKNGSCFRDSVFFLRTISVLVLSHSCRGQAHDGI